MVRKYLNSFLSSENWSMARSRASLAALRVKETNAILSTGVPVRNSPSTMRNSSVVFPVPGGPNRVSLELILLLVLEHEPFGKSDAPHAGLNMPGPLLLRLPVQVLAHRGIIAGGVELAHTGDSHVLQ